MLVSLTTSSDDSSSDAAASLEPKIVGGKGASLAKMGSIPSLASHIPNSYALTVDFFQPWIDTLLGEEKNPRKLDEAGYARLQARCQALPLNADQQSALDQLAKRFATTETSSTLLAVRSSAPEEDGTAASFAGAFVTQLGVPVSNLEQAVRDCFASRFDARVFQYMQSSTASDGLTNDNKYNASISFAAVVMEMVNSHVAGVAFSANPLNSDRDEMVVDSSFGLGESVVDGSVTADRYVYDKVSQKVVFTTLGKKTLEKKLVLLSKGGGVETATISDIARQEASSLTDAQLHELVTLVSAVEKEYGMPMDVEWAYAYIRGSSNLPPVLRLLQARPITTLFYIDDNMMTAPGEKRILYYDYNVVSDCTTTDPFTHMDVNFYAWASSAMMGFPDRVIFTDDPTMPIFKASTRQYCNLSIFLKYISTETCSKSAEVADPYLASLFASQDCDRDRYAMKKLPQGVNLCNLWKLVRQIPLRKLYKIGKACKKDPKRASLEYQVIVQQDMAKFKALEERGPIPVEEEGGGLQAFANEVFQAMTPSFEQELGMLFFVLLDAFKKLDKERREGKTEEIRSEYGALCSGYVGDGLMEMNIDIHQLANHLPEKIWQEYPHEELHKLASRIKDNLEGESEPDLPMTFLEGWKTFMNRHGWDGQNQLFPSCPRYRDSPVLLLAKLRQNVGDGVTNPAEIQCEQVENRRRVMALHEERAIERKSCFCSSELSQIQERNACLEHLMWIRNAPKLHLTQMCGILRGAVLKVEEDFLQSGRLAGKGDIFHVNLDEVDQALREESFDLMKLVRPRKAAYERALHAKECPLLVDSRCRIIRADPPQRGGEEEEKGILIGAAISPGIATGRVRIIHNPSERFERGEILAAVVTGPAWTPMFAGASAIILQVGGALQHGALCAREYGKPAVSNIDIHSLLKTGMMVTVDGGTGTIKILEVDED